VIEDAAIRSGRRVVGLVDHDQVELARVEPNRPNRVGPLRRKGLDRGDDEAATAVDLVASPRRSLLDLRPQTRGVGEGLRGLVDEFGAVGDPQHLPEGVLGHVLSRGERLPASRRHDEEVVLAGPPRHRVVRLVLVVAGGDVGHVVTSVRTASHAPVTKPAEVPPSTATPKIRSM